MPSLLSSLEQQQLTQRLRSAIPRWASQTNAPKRPKKDRDVAGLFSFGVVGITGWSVGSLLLTSALTLLLKTPNVPLFANLALGLSVANGARVLSLALQAAVGSWREFPDLAAIQEHSTDSRLAPPQGAGLEAGFRPPQQGRQESSRSLSKTERIRRSLACFSSVLKNGSGQLVGQLAALSIGLLSMPISVPLTLAEHLSIKKRLAQHKKQQTQSSPSASAPSEPVGRTASSRLKQRALAWSAVLGKVWPLIQTRLDPVHARIGRVIEACWSFSSESEKRLVAASGETVRWRQARRWVHIAPPELLNVVKTAPFNPTWTLPVETELAGLAQTSCANSDEHGHTEASPKKREVTLSALLAAMENNPAGFYLPADSAKNSHFSALMRSIEDTIALEQAIGSTRTVGGHSKRRKTDTKTVSRPIDETSTPSDLTRQGRFEPRQTSQHPDAQWPAATTSSHSASSTPTLVVGGGAKEKEGENGGSSGVLISTKIERALPAEAHVQGCEENRAPSRRVARRL